VLTVMRFFPFYYVSYLPSLLLMGRNGHEALQGGAVLIAWNLFFAALNAITWKRLKVKYDGVGI